MSEKILSGIKMMCPLKTTGPLWESFINYKKVKENLSSVSGNCVKWIVLLLLVGELWGGGSGAGRELNYQQNGPGKK